MTTRLEIINDALIATGNNECAVEYDGSDEWTVALSAYSRGVKVLLGKGVFSFATSSAVLLRTGASPLVGWQSAFAMPAGVLSLRSVTLEGASVPYAIHDNRILMNADTAVATFVREPPPDQWPDLFVEALTLRVEAGLMRGLNKDDSEGDKREARSDAMFETASVKSDQQTPGRAMFLSRTLARRRGGYRGRG